MTDEPNAETQEAMRAAREGKTTSFGSVAALLDDLHAPLSMPAPIDRAPMKALLETMLRGWVIADLEQTHRESAMLEACEGDALKAQLLELFSYWSNDVESLAAHYGLALARRQPDGTFLHHDGTIDTMLAGGVLEIVHIDPAPSPDHYWHAGAWHAPMHDLHAEDVAIRDLD